MTLSPRMKRHLPVGMLVVVLSGAVSVTISSAVQGEGGSAGKATPISELFAPVHVLADMTSKVPASLRFDRAGNDTFSLSGEMSGKQATVNLLPKSGVWDISKYSFVRIDFVNNGPGLVWIRGRLDNDKALDWANSSRSQAFVMPGERAMLGFPFQRAKDLNDSPPLFAMQGAKPNGHRDHWMKFDPAKVIGCRLVIQSTSSNLQLDDFVISLAFPYGAKANAERLDLPYLDKFGQVQKLDWPGKLREESELKQRHEAELVTLKKDAGPSSFNKYGGWEKGPQLKATGFFRLEKVDGKWWLVDPSGRLFFSHGANSVGFDQITPIPGREAMFTWLPDAEDKSMVGAIEKDMMRFMVANLVRTFGPYWQEPARDRLHRRYRNWGMNTIGAWSDSELLDDQRTPFTPILHLGHAGSPLGNKIVDPFTEGFKESVKKGLRKLVPDPKNPWVVGVFIDNEIYWNKPFVQNAFLRGVEQPARIACVNWLKEKYGSIEKLNTAWGTTYADWDKIANLPEIPSEDVKVAVPSKLVANEGFLADLSQLKRLIAGTYYRICHEAMREVLPNHLYLGSRMHVAGKEIYEESAKYVDVISGNTYDPVAGGKSGMVGDKPCMEAEFHFGAPDRGVPGVGLWPVGDQTQRSRAYVAYVVSALRHPKVVGTHWFAFADQSAAARPVSPGGSSGENYQIGFVDVTDTPYPEIAQASRAMAERMYEIGANKSLGLLESLEKLWRQDAGTAKSFSYRVGKSEGLKISEDGDLRKISGRAPFRLELKPAEGRAWNFDAVRVLGLKVKNTASTDLVLDIMARNEGASTFAKSALGRTVIKAGEELPLAVALQRQAGSRALHPAYLQMSGRPNGHFRHWHTFDPARVQDLVITSAQAGNHNFTIGRLFPVEETDESLAEVLPILDCYGQSLQRTWRGKVYSDNDIKAKTEVEDALIQEIGPAQGLNKFGGWEAGPQLKATGFFRTEKVDGKFWFVDPAGRLFWSFGANCIGIDFAGQTLTERDQAVFQKLPAKDDPVFGRFHVKLEVEENFLAKPDVPHYDFTRANLFRKYGEGWEKKQVDRDIERLKYTHLNTIGAWSDSAIVERRKVPYVAMVHYVYPEAAPKLPDPFNKKTRLSLRKALQDYPVKFAGDPWCLGALVDNELRWKNTPRELIATIFGHTTTGSEARKALIQFLREKHRDIAVLNKAWKTKFEAWDDLCNTTNPELFGQADADDCAALTTLFADTYASMVREELTAYSPNVLYLGCRMNAASPEVIAALARHADVISANIYSYRPELKQYGGTDKPVLISEFHFANVSGNNLGGGLRSAQDAVQQGRLLEEYIAEAVKDPKLVGAHWFQWRDQSAAGRYDGENYNVGLYDVVDGPNSELVRAMAACGRHLYPDAK